MNKLTKALNWIINIVFYPLVVVVVVVGILFACGVRPYITMSGSMEPEIMTGSVCFVNTKAEYEDIQRGDVIAYETSFGGLVTHQVIAVTSEGLETKGINNEMSDGISTTAENFHGKTLFAVPYVGYVLKALQQPVNLIIVLVVLGGVFVFTIIDAYYTKKELEEIQAEQKYENTPKE